MKLTSILIGLIFATVIIGGFMQFYGDAAENYSIASYNDTEFQNFTQEIGNVNEIAIQTKEQIENVKANPLIPDTLGVLVVGGIGGVLTALSSIDSFISVSILASDYLPLGDLNDVLLGAIISALIIIFFIGIAAHYIRPSDRL